MQLQPYTHTTKTHREEGWPLRFEYGEGRKYHETPLPIRSDGAGKGKRSPEFLMVWDRKGKAVNGHVVVGEYTIPTKRKDWSLQSVRREAVPTKDRGRRTFIFATCTGDYCTGTNPRKFDVSKWCRDSGWGLPERCVSCSRKKSRNFNLKGPV